MLSNHNGIKLEICKQKSSWDIPKYLEIKQQAYNNAEFKEVLKELRKHFELNEKGNKSLQNLWNAGKIIVPNACIRKKERYKIGNLIIGN